MRRHHVVCLAFVVSAGVFVSAQTWPVIPPIPQQERFRARTDLTVTLKLNASQLLAGEQPTLTLAVRNTGTRTLRVPPHVSTDYNVQFRVFDASGRQLRSTIQCQSQSLLLTSSVRSHLRIAPGQSRTFTLDHPCGGLPPLPVGNYQFDATYRNHPDWYDVYENGASETWEGRITTPRAALTVLPLDAAAERSLIAIVDAAGSPDGVDNAIQRLGLGGSASAGPALVRRFDRDPPRRLVIAQALVHLPDPEAAAALGEAIERAFGQEYLPLALISNEDSWLRFVQRANDCSALALVINLHGWLHSLRLVKQLDTQCPDLRARLLKASQPPPATTGSLEYRHRAEHAARAASLLRLLDDSAMPQAEPPPQIESFADDIRPDPAAVPEYVREVIAGIEDEAMREEALKGVGRFGTVEDFLRLKDAFAECDEECAAHWLIGHSLVAMAFVSDLEADSAQLPFWDGWWKAHAGRTREQWAREALAREPLRSRLVTHDEAPSRAAEFLLANQGLSPALVRELTQHRLWLVRLAIADDVARADERSGGRLFIRELSNRYVAACAAANERLESLVRKRYRFDCTDPAERRQAIAHWSEVVNRLAPGFLPLTVATSDR